MFQNRGFLSWFVFYSLVCFLLLAGAADRSVRSLRYVFFYLRSSVPSPCLIPVDNVRQLGERTRRFLLSDQLARQWEDRWRKNQSYAEDVVRLRAENKRLSDLLSLPPWPSHRPIPARVWARDSTDWFQTLTIRFVGAGVSPGDGVMAVQDGVPVVIGQVREVLGNGTARVLVLTDPFSALSAHVARTGEQGLVEGRGGRRLLLNYLMPDASLQIGDEVLSSGLGGVFPPNVLIGRVSSMDAPVGAGYRRAFLTPAARINFLHEVIVLRKSH